MLVMFRINAIVTKHFEMLVRDMYDQALNKVDGRNAFSYSFMIFMSLIMKSHGVTIIRINSGGSNNRPSQISADIFDCDIRRAEIRFSPDIKAIGMVFVDLVFKFIKRRPQVTSEFFQKNFTESESKEAEIKMHIRTPWSDTASSTLGNESMDMWVPFQVSAKRMENTDKARGKIFVFIEFEKHTKYNISDSMKKAV